MATEKTPRRLGRGLDALFDTSPLTTEQADSALKEILVTQIRKNPFQPRQNFNPDELKELRESLKTSGLLQPITVRWAPKDGQQYELVAGERRLRAAMDLGWTTINAVVKDLDDPQLLSLALIENLQRSDLNPIEEAEGYDQLIKEFGHTQQSVASMVGRDRSTIANTLRVLQLPEIVRQMIRDGLLNVGQTRPLLGLSDETDIINFAREILKRGLSARDIEQRVREQRARETPQTEKTPKRGRPLRIDKRTAEIRSLEQKLRRYLQTDVSVSVTSDTQGSIKILFYSAEDLERISDLFGLTDNPQ
jgi:ParB family chromosome partitioning protein